MGNKAKKKGKWKTQEEDDCDDYPCNQQRWGRQRQVDGEENDEEHHIPDTLERKLEKFTDARENTHETTMGEERGEIQDPELDNRPRSRQERERRERPRPSDEQSNSEETHTPDTIERQTENSKMAMAIKKTPHGIQS